LHPRNSTGDIYYKNMQKIKNIAIIAHVDHGKTTLVDKILHQVQTFQEHEEVNDLILDNNDLERERGITILSKNVSVRYKGFKINIIDTPGHSDFGGEVERVLNMADGVLLLVDAFEGPMPQTRFVLEKAIELNLKPLVVINKVDKPNCDPESAHEAVFDLMCNLEASEEQLDFQTVYGSSKDGWMAADWNEPTTDFSYLLDTIVEHIPSAKQQEGTLQIKITSLDYSSYTGRIAIGRISRGSVSPGQTVSMVKRDGSIIKSKVKELFIFEGLGREKVTTEVKSGEICAIIGLEGFDIGDTVADVENPEALPFIPIDEPTMSMVFTNNTSPFFGRDGKFVTSRHIRERLFRELEKNLAMRIEETDSPDSLLVFGRGIMHLSVLIETMRREGYELQVGQPRVITKEIDGVKHEPVETASVHVPDEFSGKVIELMSQRKGELQHMISKNERAHLEFTIPSRGLIGLTNAILTATEGQAILSHRFTAFEPWKGAINTLKNGALIAMETGPTYAYGIDKLQDRGKFFITPGDEVYAGQVIGEHIRETDLIINVGKSKKLTNMRTSGADDKTNITPPILMSLEEHMEYIRGDEYLEITPKSLRIRKILLNEHDRKRQMIKGQ
jgi:GTP-binding protein